MATDPTPGELTSREARKQGLAELLNGDPLKAIGFLLYAIAEDVGRIRRTSEYDSRAAGRRG
jgi:hypothetical protein